MKNKVTDELRKAKKSYFQKINPTNPKEFWRAINYLTKQQSSIPTLIDEDGMKLSLVPKRLIYSTSSSPSALTNVVHL